MRELLRSTTAYKAFRGGAEAAHFSLVLFPDERLLRALLKECAKAFFGATDGSRTAKLIDEECFSDCIILPPAGGKFTAELAATVAEESALRPVEGDKKLFVFDAFHTVTPLVTAETAIVPKNKRVFFIASENYVKLLGEFYHGQIPSFPNSDILTCLAVKYFIAD